MPENVSGAYLEHSGTQQLSGWAALPAGVKNRCGGAGSFLAETPMATQVIAFIDYEDARSFAAAQSGGDGHFDPWRLGEAICDEMGREANSGVSAYELLQSCVFRGIPRERGSVEHRFYEELGQAWESRHGGERVYVWEHAYDEPRWRTVKELYTTLSTELFNWAQLAAAGASELAVAVLFSTDRDCAPVVRAITDRFGAGAAPRLDLAAWTGQEHLWRDWRLSAGAVRQHTLAWHVLDQVLESEAPSAA